MMIIYILLILGAVLAFIASLPRPASLPGLVAVLSSSV